MIYKCEALFEWFMQSWLNAEMNDYLLLGVAIVFIAWSLKVYGPK